MSFVVACATGACNSSGEDAESQSAPLTVGGIAFESGSCTRNPLTGRAQCNSFLDNPSTTSLFGLTTVSVGAPAISVAEEQVIQPNGFINYYGDYRFAAAGGDGVSQAGTNLAPRPPAGSAVADTMFGWQVGGGDIVAPSNLQPVGRGLRLGYPPLTVEADAELPNTVWQRRSSAVDVKLDPSVSLVPVQVVVMYSSGYPLTDPRIAVARLPNQLGAALLRRC